MASRNEKNIAKALEKLLRLVTGRDDLHVASLLAPERLTEIVCEDVCRDPITRTVDRKCVEECKRAVLE